MKSKAMATWIKISLPKPYAVFLINHPFYHPYPLPSFISISSNQVPPPPLPNSAKVALKMTPLSYTPSPILILYWFMPKCFCVVVCVCVCVGKFKGKWAMLLMPNMKFCLMPQKNPQNIIEPF